MTVSRGAPAATVPPVDSLQILVGYAGDVHGFSPEDHW